MNLAAVLNAHGTPDPAKLAEIIAAIIVWVQRGSTYWGGERWAMDCRQAPALVEWRPTGKCGVEAMGRLEGKVAIITGGARGQGALESELFAKERAKVVICDILDQEGKDVEAKVLATGGDAVYSHLDVTRDDDWQKAIDDFDQAILFNPRDSSTYVDRGITYDNMAQPERAIEDFNQAIVFDPRNGLAYANRALVLAFLKQEAEAREDADRSIALGIDRETLITTLELNLLHK